MRDRTAKYTKHAIVAMFAATLYAGWARADDLADADAAFKAGEAERAEKLYAKLVQGDSPAGRAYRNLAVIYDRSRRGGAYAEKAEALYRRAIALDPKDAEAHYQLGLHLHAEGKGDDAIDTFRAAARLDPRHADARFRLARLLSSSNNRARPGEAESLYRDAITLDPGHADAHYFLGQLLAAEGRKAEAAAVFEKGRALEPRDGHKGPDDFALQLENLKG